MGEDWLSRVSNDYSSGSGSRFDQERRQDLPTASEVLLGRRSRSCCGSPGGIIVNARMSSSYIAHDRAEDLVAQSVVAIQ